MAFPSPPEQQEMSEINVTPLVDVMLVLLVVFIVTAPLLTQAVRVNLPRTTAISPAPDQHVLSIGIDAQAQVFLDQHPVAIEAVEPELKAALARDSELHVHLYADQNVAYGPVAKVMAAAQRAGVIKLAVVTVPQALE